MRCRGAHAFFFLDFAHRTRAAFWAISRRCSEESDAALASPPFLAPSLDKATAWGFFFFSIMAPRFMYASSSGKNNIYLGITEDREVAYDKNVAGISS